MENLIFMNDCLPQKTKFMHSCRERAWGQYHRSITEHLPNITQITKSNATSSWISLKLFEELIKLNYPITTQPNHDSHATELDDEEKDIVNYIAGSIITKIKQKHTDPDVHECLQTMQAEIHSDISKTNRLTNTLNRGGLTFINEDTSFFFLFT